MVTKEVYACFLVIMNSTCQIPRHKHKKIFFFDLHMKIIIIRVELKKPLFNNLRDYKTRERQAVVSSTFAAPEMDEPGIS